MANATNNVNMSKKSTKLHGNTVDSPTLLRRLSDSEFFCTFADVGECPYVPARTQPDAASY